MSKFTQSQKKRLENIAAKTSQVPPFEGDTPAKRRARIERVTGDGWSSFECFCLEYFPHIFTLPFSKKVHKSMFEETEKRLGITMITGFRGAGKTVLMGIVYSIWRTIKGDRYIIHAAADVELAEERTNAIENELKDNRRLRTDFPELEIMDTEKHGFFLKNRTRIRARSIRQVFRGTINYKTMTRPDLIVADDIDKEENLESQRVGYNKMNKIMARFI